MQPSNTTSPTARPSVSRISKIGRIIKSMLLGYARHPACGQKIYAAYNKYVPGKCGRCGAGIDTACFQQPTNS